ncbi:MAG: hypothetical protein LC730_03360 [Acidobacteria bacterium]|nr:hypothetical protein [Acidobacteriota bacterium]MCA1608482.1 hypothetical protein [Acidobacteriota bacterium]
MSEKTRKKKDGGDKNKNNQRMKDTEREPSRKNLARWRPNKAGRGQGEQ